MIKHQERVHVLAAFGDITNFRGYTRKLSDDPTQKNRFLKDFDELLDDFEFRSGYFLKDLSDGFLCIKKIQGRNGSCVVKFLNDLLIFNDQINFLIKSQKYPRPDGFRIRVTAGHVTQKMKKNGMIDFRGDHIDLAATMLQIEKNVPFLVHESAKQLLTVAESQIAQFTFTHIPVMRLRRYKEQIYKEELGALWSLEKNIPRREMRCGLSKRCKRFSPEG